MRRSLVASGALFIASVCAVLGVHTTHIFNTVLGAPAQAFLWPLSALGAIAAAALAWMVHTALRRSPVPLRAIPLALRAFPATAILVAVALPWYLHLAETPFDELTIVFGAAAATGYCLLLNATMPFIVNSIFRLPVEESPSR